MSDQMKPAETFGARVKRARLRRGMTQAEIAAAIRKTDKFVSLVENDHLHGAAPETIVRWADALDLKREPLLRVGAPRKRNKWAAAMARVDEDAQKRIPEVA